MSRIFVPGTRILINNPTTPIGWTRVLNHDNCCLRGTNTNFVSFGGNLDFTEVFSNQQSAYAADQTPGVTVGGSLAPVTLSASQIPAHNHLNESNNPYTMADALAGSSRVLMANAMINGETEVNSPSGASHSHTISSSTNAISLFKNKNMAIKYVDLIIVERDSV